MSFFEPDPQHEPISPQLPAALNALGNKYNQLAPALGQIAPPIRNAIVGLDLQRIQRGAMPMTGRDTVLALLAAQRQQAVTQPPNGSPVTGFLGNVRSDLSAILQSIPRLPAALVREAQSLPHIATSINQARAQGMNPVAAISQAPGVRMLPGAFVVGNVAAGTPGELAEHPLFTALDVLPAARATGATRAIAQSPVGDVARRARDFAADTRPGQFAQEAFGDMGRTPARLLATEETTLRNAASRGGLPTTDPLALVQRRAATLRETYADITPERVRELTRTMQLEPAALDMLPARELAFISDVRGITDEFARTNLSMGNVIDIGGELYDLATGSKFLRMQDLIVQRSAKVTQVADRLRANPATAQDPRLTNTLTAIDAGNYELAYREFTNVGRRHTLMEDTSALGYEGMRRRLAKAAVAQRRYTRALKNTPPARFTPKLQERVGSRLQQHYLNRADDALTRGMLTPEQHAAHVAQVVEAVTHGIYSRIPGFDESVLRPIQREIARTWMDLRDQGFNPVFVHRVSPGRAALDLRAPQIAPYRLTPSQAKARTMDFTPASDDVTVALTHQGLELLAERGRESFIGALTNAYARKYADLQSEFMPLAQRRWISDPSRPLADHLQGEIRRRFAPYDPDNPQRPFEVKPVDLHPDQIWIPRGVANNLKRMMPQPVGRVGALFDPIMNVFRTSLLPLSPRWHVYNILGGAIMLAGRTDPRVILQWNHARRILSTPEGRAALPEDFARKLGTASNVIMEMNYRGGTSLRRLWDQARDASPALARAGDAGSTLVKKSFDLNAWFDDTYRTMAYLHGTDRALAKGLTREAAEKAGVELARKVLQQWDELTPLERSIMRGVFPFYGFMQHILRYVYRYPHDHPVRAAVTASFARAELEDLGTGLPQTFLNLFTYGAMDEQGNQRAVNLAGLNPFSDVADYMTLAGFLGSVNPLITTLLQQAGFDPATGGAELYPNLHYDPHSGRLIADTGNPLMNLVNNVLPQSRILTNLAGMNHEFRDLLRTNPDAAIRLIRSQAGIPVIFRNVNLPQEYAREEVQRADAQRNALNRALKTGRDSAAREWPALGPLLDQVRTLQRQGQLASYTLPRFTEPNPGAAELFGRVATGALPNAAPPPPPRVPVNFPT